MKKSIGCLLVLAALGGEGVYAQPSPEGDAAITVRADISKPTKEEFIGWFKESLQPDLQAYLKQIVIGKDPFEFSDALTKINNQHYLSYVIAKSLEHRNGRIAIDNLSNGKAVNILQRLGSAPTPENYSAEEHVRIAGAVAALVYALKQSNLEELSVNGLANDEIAKLKTIVEGGYAALEGGKVDGAYTLAETRSTLSFPTASIGFLQRSDKEGLRAWQYVIRNVKEKGIPLELAYRGIFKVYAGASTGGAVLTNATFEAAGGTGDDMIPTFAILLTFVEGAKKGREYLDARITRADSLKWVARIAGYKGGDALLPDIRLTMIETLALKNITNVRELKGFAAAKEYQDIMDKMNSTKVTEPNGLFALAMFKSRIWIEKDALLEVMDAPSIGGGDFINASIKKLNPEQLSSVWAEVDDPVLLYPFTRLLVDNNKGREALLNVKKQKIIAKMPLLLSRSLNDTANDAERTAMISALCLSGNISSLGELRADGLDEGYIDRVRGIFEKGAKIFKRKSGNDLFIGGRANQVGIGFQVVAYTLFTEGGQDKITTWMDAVKIAGVAKANLLPIDANSVDVLKIFGQTNFGSRWLVEIAKRMSLRGSPDLIDALKPLTYSNAGRVALRKLPQKTTIHFLKQIADTTLIIPGQGKTMLTLALNAGIDKSYCQIWCTALGGLPV